MTNIPFRILRDGKWQAVDIDDMMDEEILEALKRKSNDHLIRIIILLCDWINMVKSMTDGEVDG